MTDLLKHARHMRRNPTPAERVLWRALRSKQLHGLKFRRQVPIGPYIADFYSPPLRLVVEIDGEAHAAAPEPDARRDAWMRAQGLRVLRFTNRDIRVNLEGVLHHLAHAT